MRLSVFTLGYFQNNAIGWVKSGNRLAKKKITFQKSQPVIRKPAAAGKLLKAALWTTIKIGQLDEKGATEPLESLLSYKIPEMYQSHMKCWRKSTARRDNLGIFEICWVSQTARCCQKLGALAMSLKEEQSKPGGSTVSVVTIPDRSQATLLRKIAKGEAMNENT